MLHIILFNLFIYIFYFYFLGHKTKNMNGINIVVVDFEFTTINKVDTVLVSGAISNIHTDAHILKLQGSPLILQKCPAKVYNIKKEQTKLELCNILRIFKHDMTKVMPILNEL